MVSEKELKKIKTSLRISHNALDDDLEDTIEACEYDLHLCGVVYVSLDNPLILNAVKLYCKAAYTDDPVKATAYQARYNDLKACLMMSADYKLETDGGNPR